MDATTYTANGGVQTVNNSDLGTTGFQPDLAILKNRNSAGGWATIDSVRGTSLYLQTYSTNAQATDAQLITSFNTNGYSLGTNQFSNGTTMVGYQWKAGGTAVSNTSGTITSSVSANTTAGFSIVSYTGNGATTQTVGHGLGVAPQMVIVKQIQDNGYNWPVYHISLSSGYAVFLNTTGAQDNSTVYWGSVPTTTVFGVNYAGALTNQSGKAYIAYCWAPVAGFSAFGSYVGNNSTDNAFVYTGFRPKFLLIKNSTSGGSSAYNWVTYDGARSPTNVTTNVLWPSSSAAENDASLSPKNGAGGDGNIDFLSNGFKIRSSASAMGGSDTYIYMAFAENPFKYANAR